MKIIQIFGREWKTGTSWGGQYHPDSLYEWYSDDAVQRKYINDTVGLSLRTKADKLVVNEAQLTIPIATGRIYSAEKFGYGTFEAEIKLPTGKHLFPAFWLSGWLPEIDILEAFTNNKGHYLDIKWDWKNLFKFWAVETNVHWEEIHNEIPQHRQVYGQRAWFGFKNPRKKFIKYKLIWKKGSIHIYYNDVLVKEITNYNILYAMQNKTMRVIFNNSVTKHAVNDIPESEMLVKSFKYTPI